MLIKYSKDNDCLFIDTDKTEEKLKVFRISGLQRKEYANGWRFFIRIINIDDKFCIELKKILSDTTLCVKYSLGVYDDIQDNFKLRKNMIKHNAPKQHKPKNALKQLKQPIQNWTLCKMCELNYANKADELCVVCDGEYELENKANKNVSTDTFFTIINEKMPKYNYMENPCIIYVCKSVQSCCFKKGHNAKAVWLSVPLLYDGSEHWSIQDSDNNKYVSIVCEYCHDCDEYKTDMTTIKGAEKNGGNIVARICLEDGYSGGYGGFLSKLNAQSKLAQWRYSAKSGSTTIWRHKLLSFLIDNASTTGITAQQALFDLKTAIELGQLQLERNSCANDKRMCDIEFIENKYVKNNHGYGLMQKNGYRAQNIENDQD